MSIIKTYPAIAIFFFTFITTGCITFLPPEPAPREFITDHSFENKAELIETNEWTYTEKKLFSRKTQSSELRGISMIGRLTTPEGVKKEINAVGIENEGDYPQTYFLPLYYREYFWKGSVIVDNKEYIPNIEIEGYSSNREDPRGFIFMLDRATAGNTKLKFYGPLDSHTIRGGFPYLVANAELGGKNYRIYAVIDNNIFKKYNEIFFYRRQKFQIVNELNTVVAEIQDKAYSIYNTDEQVDITNIKLAIALFCIFRESAEIIDNLYGWDIPLF